MNVLDSLLVPVQGETVEPLAKIMTTKEKTTGMDIIAA